RRLENKPHRFAKLYKKRVSERKIYGDSAIFTFSSGAVVRRNTLSFEFLRESLTHSSISQVVSIRPPGISISTCGPHQITPSYSMAPRVSNWAAGHFAHIDYRLALEPYHALISAEARSEERRVGKECRS